MGENTWVFCATEKSALGNHHGKGLNASRLVKKLVFCQLLMPAEPKTHQDEQDSPVEDEVTEFDSSSDKESCAGEESNSENLQITRDVDFLMGATSRFGQSVRFNSRFVFKVKPEPGDQLLLSCRRPPIYTPGWRETK